MYAYAQLHKTVASLTVKTLARLQQRKSEDFFKIKRQYEPESEHHIFVKQKQHNDYNRCVPPFSEITNEFPLEINAKDKTDLLVSVEVFLSFVGKHYPPGGSTIQRKPYLQYVVSFCR